MKHPKLTMVATLVSGAAIFAAFAFNSQPVEKPAMAPVEAQIILPEVAVTLAQPESAQASVIGYGEAKAHHELSLSAQVTGQVIHLEDALSSGQRVKAGQLLARVDSSDYRQALAQAEKALADAKLALLEEQRQVQQAKEEWQGSGLDGEPDSPLVLRTPQLEVAEASLKQAQAQVDVARRDLARTQVRAPFDAIVISRNVEPGSRVQSGDTLATLYSTDRVEIRVPLSQAQWQQLPTQMTEQWPVQLTSSDGNGHWQGRVLRSELHYSSDDRQRALVIALDAPLDRAQPLLPGTFVTAAIPGRKLDKLWQVPSTALTSSGQIWLVDDQGTLSPANAQVLFHQGDDSFLAIPQGQNQAKVVSRPLSNYLAGMKVSPVEEARL
ncbi:efflux RND transporter periplasmic adaptor subunit [Ferrimonas sp. YFM]|uniref:efflux RND transporter periplasmic adaptor subunit n=1 Tax=Ferrimonas sp. YFM TaxID=3028878 RepID=UPI002572B75C|nr:efflux RND transporter periplasmic adaptor subunit [Ferrimonas sp. YFM]BDY05162.1 RND superfamily efflux pump MFP component [Ferrimonas sp. YFM]